mgnify:CR=1 FL=1
MGIISDFFKIRAETEIAVTQDSTQEAKIVGDQGTIDDVLLRAMLDFAGIASWLRFLWA